MHKIMLDRDYKKIHFTGIGGISMSGLAEMLAVSGYTVTGSDWKASEITEQLKAAGIPVYIGHEAAHVGPDVELLVYTAAVKDDNPELKAARANSIKTIDRAELLGQIMRCFKRPVSVSGSHGKTTTTAMISEVLLYAGFDPSVSLGGELASIGGHERLGDSEYFVVESCEYHDSFLKFYPYVGVILNIDDDHMDYFGSMEAIERSFRQFAGNIAPSGTLVAFGGIEHLDALTSGLECKIITYGCDGADIQARACQSGNGEETFELWDSDNLAGIVHLRVPGRHNVLNALAAYAACRELSVPREAIISGLSVFRGTKRRFEHKGIRNGVTVVDEYAHHPTAVRAALATAKKHAVGRIWCVFQPHTYSRTRDLMDEFAESFNDADKIILLDIYAARETNVYGVHSEDLVRKLREHGKDAKFFSTFEHAQAYLIEHCIPSDLLITMGAGDVYLLGESILKE